MVFKLVLVIGGGLGRLSDADGERLAPEICYRPGYTSRWTKAIDQAAQRGEAGTDVQLAAVGMQGQNWRQLPHEHLLHIVAALRQAGLDPEARMMAAEAIARP